MPRINTVQISEIWYSDFVCDSVCVWVQMCALCVSVYSMLVCVCVCVCTACVCVLEIHPSKAPSYDNEVANPVLHQTWLAKGPSCSLNTFIIMAGRTDDLTCLSLY